MKLRLVPLFFLLCFYSFSQQKKIDSLELMLQSTSVQDSVRLAQLNELVYLYYGIDPEIGIAKADEAILLASKLDDDNGRATALAYKGHNYSALGRDSLALKMYDAAMEIRKGQGNQAAMARLIFNKGLVYFNRSDYQRANDCNLQAFEVFKKEKDSFLMAKMLNSVGINYMYLSQYPQSLEAYMEAKTIYENLQLQENLEYANITSNIGLLYAHLDKPKLAQQFQETSLDRFRKLDFSEGIANSLTNLGRLQTDQGDTGRAIELYQEAYEIMHDIHNERGMASALTNIGIAHVEEERYRAALPFFEQTKDIYIKLSNSNNLAIVYDNLGDCHYQLYEQFGKPSDLRAAHTNFSNSLSEAKKAMSVKLQQTAHEDLAKTLMTMGDAKRAYQNLTESIVLKDSFMSIDKKEEIARLEAKYTYEKEKTELQSAFDKKQAVARAELEKQRFISLSILFGSLLFLAALGIGFVLYKKRNDALLDKKKAEFNAQVAETELKALRSQMNPHFIFNSLNSIRDYMAKNDLEQAESYLMKFAKLTRAILENSDKSWISLEDDLQLMKMYIEIESLRLQHPLAYSIEVVDEVDVENTLVPPMILQPFIENSIWHGVSSKPDQGNIKIRVAVENEFLICSIDDNGVGRQKSVNFKKNGHSMGMKITKSRLEIMNNLKNKNGSFEVIDKEVGTLVEVKLPLELQF